MHPFLRASLKLSKILSAMAFIIIATAIFGELGLRAFHPHSSQTKEAYYRGFWGWTIEHTLQVDSPLDGFQIAHPLFGHMGNPKFGRNNYGFLSEFDYPYDKKNAKEITIGVFGGSLAEEEVRHISQGLKQSPELDALRKCGFTFTTLNFSSAALKQPQQLIIFLHFLNDFDVSVSLDGHNDATLDPGREFPVEFSAMSSQLFNLSAERYEQAKHLLKIKKMQALLLYLPINYPKLMNSELYFAFFPVANGYLENKFRALEHQFILGARKVSKNWVPELRSTELVETWKKYLRIQHLVAQKNGKKDFYFILPSQYDKNSKPFSEEEKRIAFMPDKAKQIANFEAHEKLNKEAKKLKSEGFPIHFLTDAFSNIYKQIYIDEVGHINEDGRNILTDRILEVLLPELKKRFSCR